MPSITPLKMGSLRLPGEKSYNPICRERCQQSPRDYSLRYICDEGSPEHDGEHPFASTSCGADGNAASPECVLAGKPTVLAGAIAPSGARCVGRSLTRKQNILLTRLG